MSKKTPSLADAMKAGIQRRPTGRLQGMVGRDALPPVAVPMARDAYEVSVEHLQPDPEQPRQVFEDAELANLAASIKENGILQPLVVYQRPGTDGYTIIAGERRWRAAKRAGLANVPCLVMGRDFDPGLIDQLQLVENIQRADLRPIEAARALYEFVTRHELSHREAAKRVGKPKAWVTDLLKILTIPEPLLEKASRLPKSALIELARKEPETQPELLTRLLESDTPFKAAAEARGKGQNRERVTYYHETFPVENDEPIEIRWKKHPEQVDPVKLSQLLAQVAHEVSRRARGG